MLTYADVRRWLDQRLEVLNVLVQLFTAMFCIIAKDSLSPSYAGLALYKGTASLSACVSCPLVRTPRDWLALYQRKSIVSLPRVEIRTPKGCLALFGQSHLGDAQIPRHDSRAHVCCSYAC
jgi:hypothetical protein